MSFSLNFLKKAAPDNLERIKKLLELDPNDEKLIEEYNSLLKRHGIHPLQSQIKRAYPNLTEFELNRIMHLIKNIDEQRLMSTFSRISEILKKTFDFKVILPRWFLMFGSFFLNMVFPDSPFGRIYRKTNLSEKFPIYYIENGFVFQGDGENKLDTKPTLFWNPFVKEMQVGLIGEAIKSWTAENFEIKNNSDDAWDL